MPNITELVGSDYNILTRCSLPAELNDPQGFHSRSSVTEGLSSRLFCGTVQQRMEPELDASEQKTTLIPWTIVIGSVLWFLALEFAISNHATGYYVAAGMAIVMIGMALWLWRKKTATNVASVATILNTITTMGALSFVPGGWEQHVVAGTSVILFWIVGRQRQRQHDQLRGRTMAFTTTILVWFSWFSLLSASIYLNLNIGWLVVVASVMTAAAAVLVWTESGLLWRQYRWAILAMALFGAELFIATWWLPTSLLVSSTVSATTVALTIQATRHLLKGHWEEGRSRRYLLVGIVIIAFVLLTARWN